MDTSVALISADFARWRLPGWDWPEVLKHPGNRDRSGFQGPDARRQWAHPGAALHRHLSVAMKKSPLVAKWRSPLVAR
ncbi:hypothetical protein FEG63_31115 [Mycolicibacterium sphagni]|uniref:Uncharacterized protein n=1 Tax=Mycolicibacterium sphagni TaxID=1786 RepID=A0ABX2K1V5_9MYCO|nr:hypothetical protein [Mycolicibacterium sphagni]